MPYQLTNLPILAYLLVIRYKIRKKPVLSKRVVRVVVIPYISVMVIVITHALIVFQPVMYLFFQPFLMSWYKQLPVTVFLFLHPIVALHQPCCYDLPVSELTN